jgi:hypothetical protein
VFAIYLNAFELECSGAVVVGRCGRESRIIISQKNLPAAQASGSSLIPVVIRYKESGLAGSGSAVTVASVGPCPLPTAELVMVLLKQNASRSVTAGTGKW